MKKKSTFLKSFFLLSFGFSGFNANAQYCIPEELMCEFGDKITNVNINGQHNTTDCSNEGYQDYTTTVTPFELKSGGANQFDITVEDGNYEETVMVWIDFNKNNQFDADEYFLIGSAIFDDYGTGEAKTISKSIQLPSTIEDGQYRMRVKVLDGLDEDPGYSCDVYFWDDEGQVEFRWPFGEVEDYLVNISNELSTTEVVKSSFNIIRRNNKNIIVSTDVLTEINLYSITGQKVKTYKLSTKEFTLPTSTPKGVYVLKAKTIDGKEFTKKVLF